MTSTTFLWKRAIRLLCCLGLLSPGLPPTHPRPVPAPFEITAPAPTPTLRLANAAAVNTAPTQPVLSSPPNGASGLPTAISLATRVSDLDGDPLTVTWYGRRKYSGAGSFTLISLPDTQYYSASYPETFNAQTQWIMDQRLERNIAAVFHMGDVVHTGSNTTQWAAANTAMSILGEELPYGLSIGNHDQTPHGDADGSTVNFNTYFGVANFSGRPYYGDHYGSNNDNFYILFSAGGLDFVAILLEYDISPDAAVIDWVEGVLQAYPERLGILATHSLINTAGDWSTQGQAVYDGLKDQPNLILMLCGHVAGEGRRSDTFEGRTIHTLLADYQNYTLGGNGFLRIMELLPESDQILVKTYSPTLDQYEVDARSEFTLPLDLNLPYVRLGQQTGVASTENVHFVWGDLAENSEYEWYVTVSDGQSTTVGPVWSFATDSDQPLADLTVTLTDNQSQTRRGRALEYTLTAANQGPDAITGVNLSNIFPATLVNVAWSCSDSGGAVCPHTDGSGNIQEDISLPANSALVYHAQVRVAPAATGAVITPATITPPTVYTDLYPENNDAVDNDPIQEISPCPLYGDAHLLDSPPIAGDTLEVEVPDTPGRFVTEIVAGSPLWYAIDIPQDDGGTPQREGVQPGDMVSLLLNGRLVARGLCQNSAPTRLDLHPSEGTASAPTGNEGSPIPVTVESTQDWGNDVLAYAFDCDDDGQYEIGPTSDPGAACTYPDNGQYPVNVKIIDAQGGEGFTTVEVEAQNVAPTATFNAPGTIQEGDTILLSLSDALDPGSADLDSLRYAFDCGSGYDSWHRTSAADCPSSDDGDLTVRGRILDKDGGISEYSRTIHVQDVPPVVDAGGPYTLHTGQSIRLDASVTCVAVDRPCTLAWDLDEDGVYDDYSGEDPLLTFTTAGLHTARLQVSDGDGQPVVAIAMILVDYQISIPLVGQQ